MIPGSALRRLSAITGLEAKKCADACYELYVTPDVALFSFLADEKDACNDLRTINLRRVSNIVFEKQEWKCAECQQVKPLSAHHVIFRSRWRPSMGPLDVESNLRGLCAEHHGDEHR